VTAPQVVVPVVLGLKQAKLSGAAGVKNFKMLETLALYRCLMKIG